VNGPAAAALDGLLRGPALVVGGLPPDGRDLDVLVDDAEARRLPEALRSVGFHGHRGSWVRNRPDGRDEVDLLPATDEVFPASELAWLLGSALPLPGYVRLLRPSPAATLLLLARRDLVPPLAPRHEARLAAALAEDPGAVAAAGAHAAAWRVPCALAALLGAGGPRRRYTRAREQQLRSGRTGLGRLRALRKAVRG